MRNPTIMRLFAKKIYQYHTCEDSVRSLSPLVPNKDKAGTEYAIDVWAPQVEARIAKIKDKLRPVEIKGHSSIMQCLEVL